MNPDETDVEATEMIAVSVTIPMICRICHEEISHEQLVAQTDVFRPCHCREPIHRICLETWLDAQSLNDTDKKHCEVCLYEYKYRQVPPGYHRASCPELFGQYMVPTVIYDGNDMV